MITEPKKGERIRNDFGSIVCKGTLRVVPGANQPEYVFVSLIQNGSVLQQKAADIKPDDAPNTYRFETSFDMKPQGKYSFKAISTILSASKRNGARRSLKTWNSETETISFVVDSNAAKEKPAVR